MSDALISFGPAIEWSPRLCPGCGSKTTNPARGFLCGSPVFNDPSLWRESTDRTEACYEIARMRPVYDAAEAVALWNEEDDPHQSEWGHLYAELENQVWKARGA